MDELNFFMQDRRLPLYMRRRLRSFFLSNQSVQRHEHQERVLNRMTPCLKGEVLMEINRLWVSKVNFLRDLMWQSEQQGNSRLRDFMIEVCQTLTTDVHAQAEIFGESECVYVLN